VAEDLYNAPAGQIKKKEAKQPHSGVRICLSTRTDCLALPFDPTPQIDIDIVNYDPEHKGTIFGLIVTILDIFR
jgi:hypothetical protein